MPSSLNNICPSQCSPEDRNEKQSWPAIPEPKWWFSSDVRELGVEPAPDGCLSSTLFDLVYYLIIIIIIIIIIITITTIIIVMTMVIIKGWKPWKRIPSPKGFSQTCSPYAQEMCWFSHTHTSLVCLCNFQEYAYVYIYIYIYLHIYTYIYT